ncbi:hypothetical protein NCC78_01975 [Micromonospora phytophila]|uniref:hypothetical protein n=1 Tax=Micromonospora phytophila TaxID=709888 RepID=UPI00203061A8|nr:hypothetical protein [Micromonospora phytophila]MCM0673495.1 hypothetical protein [Micromonospora phytophila]
MRAANYPETTRYNYLLAAAQLGRYLGEYSPDPDADDAADDPCWRGDRQSRPGPQRGRLGAHLKQRIVDVTPGGGAAFRWSGGTVASDLC